jgi:hypothetical protein
VLRGLKQVIDLRRPVKVGTKVALIDFAPISPGQYGVQVKSNGTLQPAFADGFLVVDTLHAIFLEVQTILRRCAERVGTDVWAPVHGPTIPKPTPGLVLLVTAVEGIVAKI